MCRGGKKEGKGKNLGQREMRIRSALTRPQSPALLRRPQGSSLSAAVDTSTLGFPGLGSRSAAPGSLFPLRSRRHPDLRFADWGSRQTAAGPPSRGVVVRGTREPSRALAGGCLGGLRSWGAGRHHKITASVMT